MAARDYYDTAYNSRDSCMVWKMNLVFMSGHNEMKGGGMMCFARQKSGCQFPDKLKGKPTDCTRKQIKECHGSVKKHPCVPRKSKKK
jgi:hypothetical protein